MPTYMSAVPRSTGPPCSRRELQGLLVGAHRVAQPALGDPDVGQRDRAAEHVGRCARLAAISPCSRRTPRAPPRGRRSSRTRARSARRPLRARRRRPRRRGPAPAGRAPRCRAGRPAPAPGRHGGRRSRPAAGGTPASSTTTIRSGRSGPAPASGRVEPALGVLQAPLDPLDGSGGQQRAGVAVAEHRPVPQHARRAAPRSSRGAWPPACPCASSAPPAPPGPPPLRSRRPASACRIASARSPFSLVPVARPAVQLGDDARAARRAGAPAARRRRGGGSGTTGGWSSSGTRNRLPRSSASSIALPPPCPVTASHSGPVSRSRMEVCSRKSRTSVGLALQDLLDEVVDDVAVVAGEAGDEAAASSRPCIDSAASWSAAIHPSVRPSSAATSPARQRQAHRPR